MEGNVYLANRSDALIENLILHSLHGKANPNQRTAKVRVSEVRGRRGGEAKASPLPHPSKKNKANVIDKH